MLVREHLEECNRFLFVGVHAVGGRLVGPAHDAILRMIFPKCQHPAPIPIWSAIQLLTNERREAPKFWPRAPDGGARLNNAQGPEAVVLQLEEPLWVIERITATAEGHWLEGQPTANSLKRCQQVNVLGRIPFRLPGRQIGSGRFEFMTIVHSK